eukprot:1146599-Pelagomonas_calceolata.AAC.2
MTNGVQSQSDRVTEYYMQRLLAHAGQSTSPSKQGAAITNTHTLQCLLRERPSALGGAQGKVTCIKNDGRCAP